VRDADRAVGRLVGGQLDDELATFDATLTIPQSDLRSALKGGRPSIKVSLLPKGKLRSTDCGTTPSVGITCTQSLQWSGKVVIVKGPKSAGLS
jgi:hypothetical protein